MLPHIRTGKEISTFAILKLKKINVPTFKTAVYFADVNVEKVLVSNKIFFGGKNYKYFTGYLYDNHKVKTLHIMLSKTSAYLKSYDWQIKWIYFLIEDGDLLEKHNTICNKFSVDIKKNLIKSLSTIKNI